MSLFKKKDFLILTGILLISAFFILQGSDYLLWKFIPHWLSNLFVRKIKNQTLYDLSLGFAVSYIFYININLIPELSKEKKELPLRCARLREMQLILYDISELWITNFKYCIKLGIINRKEINKVDDLFNFESVKNVLPHIKLYEIERTYSYVGCEVHWFENIEVSIGELKRNANDFMNRYNRMEPPDLFYKISYLVNKSWMVGQITILAKVASSVFSQETTLADCINADNLKEDIEYTCQCINDLQNWYSDETAFLMNNYPRGKNSIQKYSLMDDLDK